MNANQQAGFTDTVISHLVNEAIKLRLPVWTVLMRQVIVPLIASMPDDVWKKECDTSKIPCGRQGCNCHLEAESILTILDGVRDAVIEAKRASKATGLLRQL